VISIDIKHAGAGTATPPAVGICSADQVVLTAPYAAPWTGSGLLVAGTTGTTTGAFLGATARPSVPTTAQREFAVAGVPVGHTSSTPGDLPPEDPLS
jgi:hypothetical protein